MERRNTKVIIAERIFAIYREPVYDLINQHVELRMLYGTNNSGVATTQSSYARPVPSLQYGKKDTQVLIFPLYQIIRFNPKVVILDLALGMLNLPLIVLICKLLGYKTAFWSHGYNRKTGFHPELKWSDRYRLFLLKLVDANIVYSKVDRALLENYLPKETLFVAQNTIDTVSLVRIREELEKEGREEIKNRLGVKHQFNVVFIGRMLADKNPELLVGVYEHLKTKYGIRIGIHFIGSGPMLAVIREKVEQDSAAEDFYFHGAIYDEVRNGELLFINDLMVMPGYLGLSVNHAFCFDCPVLSFAQKDGYPPHSPEVEYVINNETGFLLEEHSTEALAEAVYQLISSSELQQHFKRNIRFAVENVFPLAKMVGGVIECIDYLNNE